MANWDSYTQKTTPADADTLMIKDTAGGANKRTPFSGVWNWIVGKLTSAVISQLETTNKSIVPAINELNSNIISKTISNGNSYEFFTGLSAFIFLRQSSTDRAIINISGNEYNVLAGSISSDINITINNGLAKIDNHIGWDIKALGIK